MSRNPLHVLPSPLSVVWGAALLAGLVAGCGDKADSTDDDGDGVFASTDCDDANAAVGAPTSWRPDVDGDGFGSDREDLAIEACAAPEGFTSDASDCDDTDHLVNPNGDEVCNLADDDCDGLTDDEDDSLDETTLSTFYRDADGDGYGEEVASTVACSTPSGYADQFGDCDDTDYETNPETLWYVDEDGDGYGNPYNTVQACEMPDGASPRDTDCNDGNADISPEGQEICNELDDDCDELIDDDDIDDVDLSTGIEFYPDADADGYGDMWSEATMACAQPSGLVDDNTDCDDSTSDANPDQTEVCDDGMDNDCNGALDQCGLDGELGRDDADLTLLGPDSLAYLGYDLSGAYDLDGDGLDDILMGAYGFDGQAGTKSGAAYVQYGDSGLSGDVETDTLPSVEGAADLDYFARSVSGAGDVNGDGYDDWLVGAYGNDDSGELSGKAWLFAGGSDALDGISDADDLAEASWAGEGAGEYLGYGVAGGGDLDGDGFDEIVLGAKYAASSYGRVYLLYGSTSLASRSGDVAGAASATFTGENQYDYLGERHGARSIQDMDGDGLPELALGAYGEDEGGNGAGMTAVFAGSTTRLSGDYVLADADWTLVGTENSGFAGYDQLGPGDLDSDGYGDFVGSGFAHLEGDGVAWLFYGGVSALRGNDDGNDAHATIEGPSGSDTYFGRVLAGGDFDGDGRPGFAVGGYQYDVGSFASAGRVWVFMDSARRSGTYAADDEAQATITGVDEREYLGWVVDSGDLDGDGADDLMIGAYRAAGIDGASQGGVVSVFYGGGL